MMISEKYNKGPLIFILSAAIGITIGLIVPVFFNMIVFLGHYIPQQKLQQDYTLGLLWGMVLGAGILAWPVRFEDKRDLFIVWMIKLFVALGLMLFYEYHYSIDSFAYFQTSDKIDFGLNTDFRSIQMIANFVWINQRLVPDSYHAIKVSFAMIGLIDIYIFYRAAVLFLGREKKQLFYIFALFPSILFWTTTLGKEPIMFLGMSCYAYGVAGWYRFKQLRYAAIVLLGIFIVLVMRLWLAPVLILPLGVFLFAAVRGVWKKTILAVFMVLAILVLLKPIMVNWHVNDAKSLLAKMNVLSSNFARGGSSRGIEGGFKDFRSVLAFVPKGMFTALFRPLPGEVRNAFGLAAGIESLMLVILSIAAIRRMRLKDLSNSMIIWAVLLILTWSGIYAFVSYFNLGTAVRYRAMILPIFLGLLLYLARPQKTTE